LANYFEYGNCKKKPVEQAFLTALNDVPAVRQSPARLFEQRTFSRHTIATSSTIVPARFTVLPVSLADA
jgi:hypothetical protein